MLPGGSLYHLGQTSFAKLLKAFVITCKSTLDPPLPGAGPVDGVMRGIDGGSVDDLLDVAVSRCHCLHLLALSRLSR